MFNCAYHLIFSGSKWYVKSEVAKSGATNYLRSVRSGSVQIPITGWYYYDKDNHKVLDDTLTITPDES